MNKSSVMFPLKCYWMDQVLHRDWLISFWGHLLFVLSLKSGSNLSPQWGMDNRARINFIHMLFLLRVTRSRKGFPCGSAGKESACYAGDLGSIPGLGRSLEKGKDTHSSILAWRIPWTTVHGVARSWTRLSNFYFQYLSRKSLFL